MRGVAVDVRAAVTVLERAPATPILDGLDFHASAGSRHGIVGGSGSGKTTLARALLGRVALRSGTLRVGDFDVPPPARARLAFARTVGLIAQDAVGSLDPVAPVWRSVVEGVRLQGSLGGRREARELALTLFRRVGLADDLLDRLPSQLSGGQCQRVGIARALATRPGLLVADEPTSALDPFLQARVLDLLEEIRAECGATLVLVAHSLAIVRSRCDDVTVLHAGRAVETGPVGRVLGAPSHPRTRALVGAEPSLRVGG